MINNFFGSSVNRITSTFTSSLLNATIDSDTRPTMSTFNFAPITECCVKEAIHSLKSPATNSLDKMSLRLLKLSSSVITAPLASLFNMSIATSTFPSSWKMAQVMPVYKKGSRQDIANYRPISLLPILSKVMEHAINTQLCDYLEACNLFHANQHGFRRRKSCCSALLALCSRLFTAKNNGQFTAMASLDFSRAFDTIDHNILLMKLAKFSMSSSVVAWFKSYLADRQQYVLYNGTLSDMLPVTHGVPEGSILGPVLFLVYINDLLTSFDVIQTIAYADDVTLIASGDSKSTTITTLQAYLNTAYDWSILNKLCLNPAKCASMLLCPTKLKSDVLHETSASLYIGKTCIQYVFSMKLLGVIFSSDLS